MYLMYLGYIHTPCLLFNSLWKLQRISLQTFCPIILYKPLSLISAAYMHMVVWPSAETRTFYIPQESDSPSLSNCYLSTAAQLENSFHIYAGMLYFLDFV